MGRSKKAVEVRAALRRALVDRVASSGWREAEGLPESPIFLVGLIRPLADGFAATAEVTLALTFPDVLPVEVDDVRVGVAYEPLRRWWPLLGDPFALSLRDVSASNGAAPDRPPLEVSATREVTAAVETLASMIEESAVPYAERHASHDALLAAVSARGGDRVDLKVPALLAALGRFDEAALVLDRYEPGSGSSARRERRTAYQLRRWVNARGDESMLPDAPPPNALEEDLARRPSFADTGADTRARHEAMEAVREPGRGRERDEVRAMLERELAHRGVTMSPLELEQTLDYLWDTPAERLRRGVQALGRLGVGVTKMIRERRWPDLSTPPWLEPPEPAFYELPGGDRWSLVSLETGIDDLLERIQQAARPRVMGIAFVRAWLQPEPHSTDLAVYVGRERVGVLPADAVAAYEPIMRAASFREELPVLPARLTRRGDPPSYWFEVAQPPPGRARAVPRS